MYLEHVPYILHIIDTWAFALYTWSYDNNKQVFFTPVDNGVFYAVGGFNGVGMDGSDYVHDEILVKLRCQYR